MNLTVNGQERTVADGVTVARLIKDLGLQASATVVERNREILSRSLYDEIVLAEGDVLELVRFVGGG